MSGRKQRQRLLGYCALFLFSVVLLAVILSGLMRPKTIMDSMAQGDYERAVALLEQSSSPESASRLLMLGNLYYTGLGARQNFSKARELFTRSAFMGNSSSQYNLGLIYHHGLGVEKDGVQAAAWFLLSDSGDVPAAETYLRILSGSMNPNSIQQAQQLKVSLAKTIEEGVNFRSK